MRWLYVVLCPVALATLVPAFIGPAGFPPVRTQHPKGLFDCSAPVRRVRWALQTGLNPADAPVRLVAFNASDADVEEDLKALQDEWTKKTDLRQFLGLTPLLDHGTVDEDEESTLEIDTFDDSAIQPDTEEETEEQDPLEDARMVVEDIVSACFNASLAAAIDSENPQQLPIDAMLLMKNAPMLAKSNVYEQVMENRIKTYSGRDAALLSRIDALLRGFITQERKRRARVKVKYMLTAAMSGQLEDAIARLVSHREIDTPLMVMLDNLIAKVKTQEVPSVLRTDNADIFENDADTFDDLQAVALAESLREGVTAGRVLAALKERLEVEIRPVHWGVRLLGLLLGTSPKERILVVMRTLKKIEEIDDFLELTTDAIEHARSGGVGRKREGATPVKLSPECYETLKEIRDTVTMYRGTVGTVNDAPSEIRDQPL